MLGWHLFASLSATITFVTLSNRFLGLNKLAELTRLHYMDLGELGELEFCIKVEVCKNTQELKIIV